MTGSLPSSVKRKIVDHDKHATVRVKRSKTPDRSDRDVNVCTLLEVTVHTKSALMCKISCICDAITLRGSELAWAILKGFKLIENRSRSLGLQPGRWYALHVGLSDILEGNMTKLSEDVKGSETLCDLKRGCIVGAFHVCGRRENDSCGRSVWVEQKVCYVINATIEIFEPIKCRGKLGKWSLDQATRSNLVKKLYNASTNIRLNDLNKKNLM